MIINAFHLKFIQQTHTSTHSQSNWLQCLSVYLYILQGSWHNAGRKQKTTSKTSGCKVDREAKPFSSLWWKDGRSVVWTREHAWVAWGNKQTFIPAVSCRLDLQGATDSSWIHLALVKHVQRYRTFNRPGRSTVRPEQPRRQLSSLEMLIAWWYCPACRPYRITVS